MTLTANCTGKHSITAVVGSAESNDGVKGTSYRHTVVALDHIRRVKRVVAYRDVCENICKKGLKEI